MHAKGICHRDIKPENILLDKDCNLKIADFGFAAPAKGKDGSGKLKTYVGTLDYMAPEIHLGMPYDGKKDDVFSAGIILFMMLTARPPFRCAKKDDAYYKLIIGKRPDLFWQAQAQADDNEEDIYSDEFKSLFEGMCAFNPSERFTIEQALAHPWFSGATLSPSEATAEFKRRKGLLNEVAQEAQEEKRSNRASREKKSKEKKVSRGEGDEDKDFEKL